VSKIIIKKKIPQAELDALKVSKWPTWEKEVSTFDWTYPEQEMAYIVEGQCLVTPIEDDQTPGVTVKFSKGDFVVFPAGLSVKWEILKPLRKHYQLDGNLLSRTLRRIKFTFKH